MTTTRFGYLVVALVVLTVSNLRAKNPLAQEERAVTAVTDASKSINVPEGMVWYDASPATKGLRFPPGTYLLETEDSGYRYFRSEKPLELVVIKNGRIVDSREIPGGLMLSKKFFSRLPGAGYIDHGDSSKMMIWKLGRSFLNQKGRAWKPNF